jgi:hypothetical protein
MLRLYAPVAAAVLAIAGMTYWESVYSDRFVSSSVTAAEFGERFKNVPKAVGSWVGTDVDVGNETLEMAGAVNYVSRRYVNGDNNKEVELWLIVGHARDICRHTPDICYPSQGFSQQGSKVKHTISDPDNADRSATFFTAKFKDESTAGSSIKRVFWAWNGNQPGKDRWEAPEPTGFWSWLPFKPIGPKTYYGNNTALYKVYFTAKIGERDEAVADNVAVEFAKLMLPEVDRVLFPERYAGEPKSDAREADSAQAEPIVEGVPEE